MSEEIKGVKEFLEYCENFKEAIKNISNFEKKCGRYIDVEINRRKNKAEDISNYEKEDFFENFKYGLKGAFEGCFGVPLKNKVNSPAKIVLKDIVKKMIKSKKIEDLKKVFDLDKYIKKLKGGINSRICDKEVKKEFESFENKVEELFEEYKGILEKVKKSAEAKQMIKEVIRSVEIAADESEEHLLTGLVEKRLSELQELVNKLNELGGKEKSIIEIIGNAKKLIGAKIDEELGRLSELVFSARNREEYVQDSIKEMSEKIKKREVDGLENEIEKIEEELKELKNDENDLNESLKITVLDEEIIFEKLIERSDFNLGRLEGMLKRVKDDYGKCLEDLPNIEKGINYENGILRISDCIKKINAADIEKWKADITEVNIKGKDTEIGASFFSECDKLETITLPDAMTIIRDYLFLDCSSLKTIDLSNVTTIGRSAFDKCTSLKTIDLSNVTTIGRSAFNKCTSLEEIKIPKVAKIGCYAFDKCTSLKKIKIPASVKVINAGVFRGCTSLKEITFEGEIPKMGKNAIPEAFPKGIEKIKYKEASEEKIESIKKAIGNPKLKFEKI